VHHPRLFSVIEHLEIITCSGRRLTARSSAG
jgi:hypothetical protein